ncbi:hypothetical protein DL98DRAFT_618494 [Cadophora sp. DSE1049]|nr:hypothetical protein DL98DRAFT_618494 [Cadophora sp. DSE1049]
MSSNTREPMSLRFILNTDTPVETAVETAPLQSDSELTNDFDDESEEEDESEYEDDHMAERSNTSKKSCRPLAHLQSPQSEDESEDDQMAEPWIYSTPLTRRPLDYTPPPLRPLAPAGPIPKTPPPFPGITQSMPSPGSMHRRPTKLPWINEAIRSQEHSLVSKQIEFSTEPGVFKCSKCLKTYKDKRRLEAHVVSQCGTIRKFKCPYDDCYNKSSEPSAFANALDLDSHLWRRHAPPNNSDQRPCPYEDCYRVEGFNRRDNVKEHVKSKHQAPKVEQSKTS